MTGPAVPLPERRFRNRRHLVRDLLTGIPKGPTAYRAHVAIGELTRALAASGHGRLIGVPPQLVLYADTRISARLVGLLRAGYATPGDLTYWIRVAKRVYDAKSGRTE